MEVADGLVGLDAATGQPRWHREIDHLLEASFAGAERLIYAKAEPTPTNAWRTYLGWIDLRVSAVQRCRVPL